MIKACDTKARKEKRGKRSGTTSKVPRKTATHAKRVTSFRITLSAATTSQLHSRVRITHCRGITDKYTFNADVVMVQDKDKLWHIDYTLLKITEKKSSKNSKRGGGK